MTNRLSFSNYASSASMEGFLEKHGGLVGTFLVKKYWCVLDEGKLSYFKDPNKMGVPQGALDVAKMQSVRVSSAKGFCFEVTSGSKTQVFAAQSTELRDRWIRSLQDAMSIASRRPSLQRASICSRQSFDEEEQVSTPFTNPAMGVIVESGSSERSSSYRMSTPDASASMASNADEDSSNVPYKGYVNGPHSVTGTDGPGQPGSRYVESSDSDEEPPCSTPVEVLTRASLYPENVPPTLADGGSQGLPTHSEYLPVVGEQGVMEPADETSEVRVIDAELAGVSGPRDDRAEPVPIPSSGKLQRETEVEVTSRIIEDDVSVLPVPTPVVVCSEYLAPTAPYELDKISPEKRESEINKKPPESARRMVQRRPTVSAVDKTAADDTVVVELVVDNSFVPSAVPELQHGLIASSEHESSFDQLKSFLAQIRSTGGSYVRPTQSFSSHPGKAISNLKFFLANID